MKRTSLKKFLKEYSIFKKRKTTISHAFASAATPLATYDDENTAKALKFLGQDSTKDLRCIYCRRPAKTWDHLVSLVEKGEMRDGGYGHQLGNLVPCCKDCNSDKQNKDFRVFVTDNKFVQRLEKYQQRFATVINVKACERRMRNEWRKYRDLKEKIFRLMKKADKVAVNLREGFIQKSLRGSVHRRLLKKASQ